MWMGKQSEIFRQIFACYCEDTKHYHDFNPPSQCPRGPERRSSKKLFESPKDPNGNQLF